MNHQRRNVPACNTSSRPRGCSLPAVVGSGRGSPPYYCCCAGSSWPATSEAHSRSPQVCNRKKRRCRPVNSGGYEAGQAARVISPYAWQNVVNCARVFALRHGVVDPLHISGRTRRDKRGLLDQPVMHGRRGSAFDTRQSGIATAAIIDRRIPPPPNHPIEN